MNINTNKTEGFLVCARNSAIRANIYLNGQLITQVQKFKYSGNLITSNGRSAEKIKQRIGQAKSEFIKEKEIIKKKKKPMNIGIRTVECRIIWL